MSITPADCATQLLQQMANMHRWKSSALAAAALALGGLYAADASALALGRITVQSALGEPLRAEIDLPQISASEAETLRTQVAPPETFRAQGMEYSPAINGVQVQLQRRSDGSMVLRLSSTRPMNEPFVDLVLNASWGSGQIVRSYTMLFDPPALRQQPAAVTAPAQASAAPAAIAAPAVSQAPRSTATAAAAPAATPHPAPRPAADTTADGVTVRPGDTAGRLASAHRPSGVSLDQMLVAMMRSNPDAFVGGNVNRLKSGVVLHMPDAATAQAVSATEARQIMATQSRDFNEFRRKLAASAPSAEVATQSRSASGKVQTQVEDKRPAQAAPDKLTLSKGAIKSPKGADEKLAQDKQSSENAARMAELSRNISELNKISAASAATGASAAAPAATAASAPSIPVPVAAPTTPAAPASQAATPAVEQPAASAPVAVASATADAPAPQATASAEASPPPPAPKPQPAPAPEPAPEPSFIDGLLGDPLIPLAGGGILALLLGYGGYRVLQRRRQAAGGVDSSFMESKLQPDSFFGQSGGQRVDTANSEMTTGSSLAYSPSQLDAGGDVDPVAEADVYLAYGRDLQAEEILKEAARHNPDRTSIQVKLAEIYAKRQDRKALEAVAGEVFRQTNGQGPDWNRVAGLGRDIDPENPIYQPGGQPGMKADVASAPAPLMGDFPATTPMTAAAATAAPIALPPDLDLDLDLDLATDVPGEAPASAPGNFAAAAAAAAQPEPMPEPLAPLPELDQGTIDVPDLLEPPVVEALELPEPLQPEPPSAEDAALTASLDFPTEGLQLLDSAALPLETAAAPAQSPAAEPSLEFDLGDLSLDLASTPAPLGSTPAAAETTEAAPLDESDPLSTKLALAEEFHAIGDSDGARTLIEEVIAEASGPVKARAQRLLADLG